MTSYEGNPFIPSVVTRQGGIDTAALEVVTSLAIMLGGGDIIVDGHDLANAAQAIAEGRVFVTRITDPPQLIISIKERRT